MWWICPSATADYAVEIRAQVDRLTVQKPTAEADAQDMSDRWRDQLFDAHSSIGVLESDVQRLE